MFRKIGYEFYEFLEILSSLIPGVIGNYCRRFLYKIALRNCGEKLTIGLRVRIQRPSNIIMGHNISINYGVWIASNYDENGSIEIGNDVLIGPYTILHSGNHNYEDPNLTINKQGFRFSKIVIEDDVWIAARCTILSGVTIGKGSVIAAGSVVTKNVPPYSIVAGVPGKVVAKRN